MNVLLVDDESDTLQTLKQEISWKKLGIYEVCCAENIADAKALVQNRSIQIVITDIHMPGGSGLELIAWLTQYKPDIVKIILTCHPDFSYASFALKHDVLDYLLKPVEPGTIEAILAQAVKRARETAVRQTDQLRHRRLLSEQFWQNLANGLWNVRDRDYVLLTARQQNIPFDPDLRLCPVLFTMHSSAPDGPPFDAAFIFSMKNLLDEGILQNDPAAPPSLSLSPEQYLALPAADAFSAGELKRRCSQIVVFLKTYCEVNAEVVLAGQALSPFELCTALTAKSSSGDELLSRIDGILEKNPHRLISCEEIARQVYLNPDYLSRLFRKKTGKKLSSYLLEKKMESARTYLRTTEKPVSEISALLGYDNFSNFSRSFRKVCKMSPQEYRKSQRQESACTTFSNCMK